MWEGEGVNCCCKDLQDHGLPLCLHFGLRAPNHNLVERCFHSASLGIYDLLLWNTLEEWRGKATRLKCIVGLLFDSQAVIGLTSRLRKGALNFHREPQEFHFPLLFWRPLGVYPKRKGYNYIRYYWNLHLDFGIMFSFPLQMNHSSTEVIEFWFCFLLLFFFVFCFCNIQLWIFDNENAKHKFMNINVLFDFRPDTALENFCWKDFILFPSKPLIATIFNGLIFWKI